MALGSGLLQLLGAVPRECFSNSESTKSDITAICHDVRGLELAEDEKVFITVKDLRKHTGEQLSPLGGSCFLKSVEFDSSLLLRIWAARDEEAAKQRTERRNCGELRLPLQQLATVCDGMLYQTWVTLECPGLNDSVASIGLGEDSASLEQRLVEGPRQLAQPRTFLTVGRTCDLGEQLLAADCNNELRIARWGPLLRSHRQHTLMSAALHLQASPNGVQSGEPQQQASSPPQCESPSAVAARLQEVRCKVREQAEGTEALRRQVTEAEGDLEGMREATRRCMVAGSLEPLNWERARSHSSPESLLAWKGELDRVQVGNSADDEALGKTKDAEAEVARLRASNGVQETRATALRAELERVRRDGNMSVDAANERIQTLKREREEAIAECKRLSAEGTQLAQERDQLGRKGQKLEDEVQALKRLVEELYESLNGAGICASRKSVDSINAIFKIS